VQKLIHLSSSGRLFEFRPLIFELCGEPHGTNSSPVSLIASPFGIRGIRKDIRLLRFGSLLNTQRELVCRRLLNANLGWHAVHHFCHAD
jgi:hypothetical protein